MPSYYGQHPALKPVYGKKPVVGLTSYFPPMYGTVFELAQGLQDSRTSEMLLRGTCPERSIYHMSR